MWVNLCVICISTTLGIKFKQIVVLIVGNLWKTRYSANVAATDFSLWLIDDQTKGSDPRLLDAKVVKGLG